MSWTDYGSIEQIKKFRDLYKIKTFVETGTFRGVNTEVHAKNFEEVYTCEIVEDFFKISGNRLKKYPNVSRVQLTSPKFLECIKKTYLNKIIFIYLDAHFYDPALKPWDRWVVIKELKALKNFSNCVIAIHDFDNGELGHLVYDGQPLNFGLIKDYLYEVNPHFHYYTNVKKGCDIVTEKSMLEYYPHVEMDDNIIDTLDFVWSNEEKTYRGILYCTPTELNLDQFNLRKL